MTLTIAPVPSLGTVLPPQYRHASLREETQRRMQYLIGLASRGEPLPAPFDGSNPIIALIQEYGGRWQALDAMYNLTVEDMLELWLNIQNIQAVYNRKELVRSILEQLFISNPGQAIRILELAAGSAQALLEAMQNAGHKEIYAHLVDVDPTALERALELAYTHGVSNQIKTTHGRVLFAESTARESHPNVVEMVGLADYLEDKLLLRLFRQFRLWLPQRGILITGNVLTGNPEQKFIHGPYRWPAMQYRTMEQFQGLIAQAGFMVQSSFIEPHHIHGIVVASKEG